MANARTARDAALARKLHFDLVVELGGVCVGCGEFDRLEVNHVDGITWDPTQTSQLQRIRLYWREYRSGVRLSALCRSCNARDGARRRVLA